MKFSVIGQLETFRPDQEIQLSRSDVEGVGNMKRGLRRNISVCLTLDHKANSYKCSLNIQRGVVPACHVMDVSNKMQLAS